MGQLEIPLMQRIEGPAIVPRSFLNIIRTYRQAVRLCWVARRIKGMKVMDLARDFHFVRQHVSDYLHEDDAPGRRNLPADRIKDFEDACGNAAITQWLASRQSLTVVEELQAMRTAA